MLCNGSTLWIFSASSTAKVNSKMNINMIPKNFRLTMQIMEIMIEVMWIMSTLANSY